MGSPKYAMHQKLHQFTKLCNLNDVQSVDQLPQFLADPDPKVRIVARTKFKELQSGGEVLYGEEAKTKEGCS